MDSRIGLPLARAASSASWPQGYQSHGIGRVLLQVGARFPGQPVLAERVLGCIHRPLEYRPMSIPVLKLKRGEDRRLRAGHLWIFSNEVDTAATPLTQFEPGAAVQVHSDRDQFLGHSPTSIRAR